MDISLDIPLCHISFLFLQEFGFVFFADGGDVKIDFVLGLDGDVGTESVVAGLLVVILCCIIEGEDFVSILLLVHPLQETAQPICSVCYLLRARYGGSSHRKGPIPAYLQQSNRGG